MIDIVSVENTEERIGRRSRRSMLPLSPGNHQKKSSDDHDWWSRDRGRGGGGLKGHFHQSPSDSNLTTAIKGSQRLTLTFLTLSDARTGIIPKVIWPKASGVVHVIYRDHPFRPLCCFCVVSWLILGPANIYYSHFVTKDVEPPSRRIKPLDLRRGQVLNATCVFHGLRSSRMLPSVPVGSIHDVCSLTCLRKPQYDVPSKLARRSSRTQWFWEAMQHGQTWCENAV